MHDRGPTLPLTEIGRAGERVPPSHRRMQLIAGVAAHEVRPDGAERVPGEVDASACTPPSAC
jgi:hypothetical protein